MLTKTIEKVFEISESTNVMYNKGDKILIATLEHQRDDRFHEEFMFLNNSLTRAANELECHQWQRGRILEEMKFTINQPLYTTNQFLRKGVVDIWVVTKMQVLNSLLHYNGIRIRTLKNEST